MTDRTLRVLSADAPKIGLRAACRAFSQDTGHAVEIELLTAPRIRERVRAHDARADIIVIPKPGLRDLSLEGLVDPSSISVLGGVAVAVAVHERSTVPDIATLDKFRHEMIQAPNVVYNTASSGLYVAEMLERIGLTSQIAAKTDIVGTGAAIMSHLANAPPGTVGFCHETEIRLHENEGISLVGPLPEEIGRVTKYAAGALANGPNLHASRSLIGFLALERGLRFFRRSGVN